MKKGSFKCLVMREFYMCRKSVIPGLIAFMAFAGLVILLQLSFKVGNLALLPQEFGAEFLEMFQTICFFPVALANVVLDGTARSSADEGAAKWKRFRLATPVHPVRFAAAKYTIMVIQLMVSVLLVGIYVKIVDVMKVVTVDKDFVAISMMIFLVMIIYAVAMQVLSMFFCSVDKAGMVLMGVGLACMVLFFSDIETGAGADKLLYEQFVNFCRSFMLYVPLCIVATFATGFGATTMLYKRREK